MPAGRRVTRPPTVTNLCTDTTPRRFIFSIFVPAPLLQPDLALRTLVLGFFTEAILFALPVVRSYKVFGLKDKGCYGILKGHGAGLRTGKGCEFVTTGVGPQPAEPGAQTFLFGAGGNQGGEGNDKAGEWFIENVFEECVDTHTRHAYLQHAALHHFRD